MQPQETSAPNQGDFGFMLNQQQPQQPSGGRISGLGKPAKILVAVVLLLVIAIVAAAILGGGGDNSKQVVDLMVQNQEIVRVSKAQDQKFTDSDTKGLSATTQIVMSSQRVELADYLTKAKIKYDPKQLAAKTNQQTDAELHAAAQNNNLDAAYINYLKTSLSAYLSSINSVYQATGSETLKLNLKSDTESIQMLLDSPQFKS